MEITQLAPIAREALSEETIVLMLPIAVFDLMIELIAASTIQHGYEEEVENQLFEIIGVAQMQAR